MLKPFYNNIKLNPMDIITWNNKKAALIGIDAYFKAIKCFN
jgi:hypothetical protein